jgi:hypothetical protein
MGNLMTRYASVASYISITYHSHNDNDSEDWYGHLWEDYPEGSLHGRWSQVGDMIIAGVGGILKERVAPGLLSLTFRTQILLNCSVPT